MTDKVYHSFGRTYRSRAAATAIQFAGGSDGWVVPSNQRLMEDPEGDLATGAFNAFAESHSSSSFDVTIETGESLVGGAYIARDTTTTVTLSSSTAGQTVYVGWGDSQTDSVIIGKSGAFGGNDPKLPIWTVDTDGSGVTSTTDERNLDDYRVSNANVQGLRNFGNAALNDYPLLNTDLSNPSLSVAGNPVSLGGSTSIDHSDLSSIGASDHHSRYTDSEASSAAPIQSVNGSTGSIEVITASEYSVVSKSENTVYQNTSNYAIKIAVRMDVVSGGSGFDGAIYTDASSSSLESSSNQIDYTVESPYFLQGIIPSGNYYEVWGDSLTSASWLESLLS